MTDVIEVDGLFFEDLHRDYPWLEIELKKALQACHVKCYARYETGHLSKDERRLLKNYLAYRTGAAI